MIKRVLCILFFLIVISLKAKTFQIITPYVGSLSNQLKVEQIEQDLKDSALMEGLYFQWLNTEKYQWNVFLYHSANLNESTILGSHFIFDYYFCSCTHGKFMVGAGVDIIQIDTDAENIHPLQNFQMLNRIYSPYIRGGRYFDFGCNAHRYSVFIWGGYEHDILRGDLSFDIPPYAPQMPPIHISEDLDKDYHYGLIGIAFKATFFHFLEIKLKYHRKIDLNRDELLNYTSILTNLYLSRKWGVSYRYKYMDEIIGENIYHIGGVVYMF